MCVRICMYPCVRVHACMCVCVCVRVCVGVYACLRTRSTSCVKPACEQCPGRITSANDRPGSGPHHKGTVRLHCVADHCGKEQTDSVWDNCNRVYETSIQEKTNGISSRMNLKWSLGLREPATQKSEVFLYKLFFFGYIKRQSFYISRLRDFLFPMEPEEDTENSWKEFVSTLHLLFVTSAKL